MKKYLPEKYGAMRGELVVGRTRNRKEKYAFSNTFKLRNLVIWFKFCLYNTAFILYRPHFGNSKYFQNDK